MFSKFSVLSKFFKYPYMKQNGLRRMLRCECRSIMTRQKLFIENLQNKYSDHQDNRNVKPLHFNQCDQLNITRNMGSSNNEGDEKLLQKSAKVRKLIEKRKKKFLRRRSKVKILQSSQMKCKRCETKNMPEVPKIENLNKGIALLTKNLSNNKGTLKMENPDLTNSPGISQSHIPPKKVHVEFMESQNLKDFNLNKNPSSEPHRNSKQNLIDIKIEPINLADRKPSNVKSIGRNIKNSIYNLETQHFMKSNLDYNKKRGENNTVKVPETKDPTIVNKNSLTSVGNTFRQTVSNDNNNSKISKKSENMRILYHAQPKRKTKVNIPKLMKSGKTTRIKLSEQDKTKKVILTNQPKATLGHKGILFPTEPGEFLNFKIQSKNLTMDIKPFATSDKGILYPTEKCELKKDSKSNIKINPLPHIDTNLIKISSTKKDLNSAKNEINTAKEEISKPKFPANNLTFNNSKTPTNFGISSKGISKHASSNHIPKVPTNPRLETVKNSIDSQDAEIAGCNTKVVLAFQTNKKSKNSLKNLNFPNDALSKYSMSPDKLKNYNTKFKAVKTVPQRGRPKTMAKENLGSANLKTNKLTKSKISSRGGNQGGNQGGGGHKTPINKKATTIERPSRFWRSISLTILPLILGLTVYTMSNIGAAEMFKRMRNSNSSEDPLSWKILPTLYGRKSSDKLSELNDIESEEKDDEEPLSEIKDGNEQLATYFKDPRLSEA